MSNTPSISNRIRSFLNKAIKGKFANALIDALAKGDGFNEQNIVALKDNIFIATAEQRYLDKLLASYGIVRPPGVGIDDKNFRDLAISITNKKLVTSIFLEVLELFYGEDAVKANVLSSIEEPYTLSHGMDLYIEQDGKEKPLKIEFKAADFKNIAAAQAIEIATVISREAVKNGYSLYATDYLDSTTGKKYVQVFSGTRGPKSYITIVGGSAQNVLIFPALKLTTQMAGTAFDVTINGGVVRYTWIGGPDPGLQNVEVGDYVNIKSPPFPSEHAGSFTIKKVVSDVVGLGFFEIENPIVQTTGSFVLSSIDDLRFFKPKKNTINDLKRFATIYEVNPYETVIFIPATTRIVKRDIVGAWHIHNDGADTSFLGSYLYNPKSGYLITKTSTVLGQKIEAGQSYSVIPVGNSIDFKDEPGFLVFDFGTSNQEGPVRYLGRPSNNTLLLDAAYTFKKTHLLGSNVSFLRHPKPFTPSVDGLDYPTYLTGTIKGRIEAEKISKELAAAGIFLNIIIVYPNGPGLNNVKDVYSGD